MKRRILCADITQIASDAMIYSTNVRLTLTGGVGAALFRAFGVGVQIDLQTRSPGTGRELAEVGDIIETHIPGSPWKGVFHTIATSELYHTDAAIVARILRRCLARCAASDDLRKITCSALGTGYGDLELPHFFQICDAVCTEFDGSPLQEFAIIIQNQTEFETLRHTAEAAKGWETTEVEPLINAYGR